MPAEKSIIWDFPRLGWNTNQAKRDQPADTTPDVLNVMPYEPQSGRQRGGSRPGTAKQYASALVASKVVQTLAQNTIPYDLAFIFNATGNVPLPSDFVVRVRPDLGVGATGPKVSSVNGTSVTYGYTYSTSTAATDPGSGGFKFNNATMSLVTRVYLSETTAAALNIATIIATWDDDTAGQGTYGKSGFLKIWKTSDASIFRVFAITAANADNGAWDTLTVAYVATNGALSNGDAISIRFFQDGENDLAVIVQGNDEYADAVLTNGAPVRTLAYLTTAPSPVPAQRRISSEIVLWNGASNPIGPNGESAQDICLFDRLDLVNHTPTGVFMAISGGIGGVTVDNTIQVYVTLNRIFGGEVQQLAFNSVYIDSTDATGDTITCNIDLRVDGDVYHAYVNGLLINSTTVTTDSDKTGVGFGFFWTNNSITTGLAVGVKTFELAADNNRISKIVAVCNGAVFTGNLTALALATGGTGVLSLSSYAQVAFFDSDAYFVDGFVTLVKLNLFTSKIETYADSAGTAPSACTLICSWRGRLVLCLGSTWFMSRINDPTDWDYGQTDEAAAVYHLGDKTFGAIGDLIVAVAPLTNDALMFFCDHTIYTMEGDAIGGSIVISSEQIGGLGPDCWAKDPSGVTWFAGTSGFYKVAPGSPPECVSNSSVNEFFRALNRTTQRVVVRWDRDRWGCWIFITIIATGASVHLFYDARNGGFWRMQYPNDYGPISAIVYDGDAPTDRILLMGGRTGFIYHHDDTIDHDDGNTAISSYVWLGPFAPNEELVETKTYGLRAYLSDQQNSQVNRLDWTLQAGSDAAAALSVTPDATASGSFAGAYGRQLNDSAARLRGTVFALKVYNSTLDRRFSFERMLIPIGAGAKIF